MSNSGTDTTLTPFDEMMGRDISMSDEDITEAIKNWDVSPFGQRCHVAKLPAPDKVSPDSALYIPQEKRARSLDGVVIAAGPIAYINDGDAFDEKEYVRFRDAGSNVQEAVYAASLRRLKPGDKVTFANWSGETVTRTWTGGRAEVCVMNAEDILGKVE